jgi:hypothetical protein
MPGPDARKVEVELHGLRDADQHAERIGVLLLRCVAWPWYAGIDVRPDS